MLRPPLVRLRFGLWLPILRNSAQHLTMPHFLFSSHGSRTVRRDFNPCIDMLIFFPMSCLFIFLSYASRHASHGPRIASQNPGHRSGMLRIYTAIDFYDFVLSMRRSSLSFHPFFSLFLILHCSDFPISISASLKYLTFCRF